MPLPPDAPRALRRDAGLRFCFARRSEEDLRRLPRDDVDALLLPPRSAACVPRAFTLRVCCLASQRVLPRP